MSEQTTNPQVSTNYPSLAESMVNASRYIPEVGTVYKTGQIAYNVTFWGAVLGIIIAVILVISAVYMLIERNYAGFGAAGVFGVIIGAISIHFFRETNMNYDKYIVNKSSSLINKLSSRVSKLFSGEGENIFNKINGRGENKLNNFNKLDNQSKDKFIGDTIEEVNNDDSTNISGSNEDGCNCDDKFSTGGVGEYFDNPIIEKDYVDYLDQDNSKHVAHNDYSKKNKKNKKSKRYNKYGADEISIYVEGSDNSLEHLKKLVEIMNLDMEASDLDKTFDKIIDELENFQDKYTKLNSEDKKKVDELLKNISSEEIDIANKIQTVKNKIGLSETF